MTTTTRPGGGEAGPPAARLQPLSGRPWRIIVSALAGLLLGVTLAGLVALGITLNVGDVVNNALRHDIELEDESDDLRAAVLDLRHYHRNLVFTGPTRTGLADFEAAYAALLVELGELELVGVQAAGVVDIEALRDLVTTYYANYRPAIALWATDRAAFDTASDDGLAALGVLGGQAEDLEDRAEALSVVALRDVDRASATAIVILVIVLVGLVAAGLALVVAAVRVLRELRGLYAAQQSTADQLALALRARTDFIADASHELRTPLTVLRGNAEVGLASGPHDCDHRRVLHEIVAESERMTRLVEDLLFLARYDAGSLPLELGEVDLEPWLAELAARGELLARGRGVSLSTDLAVESTGRLDARRVEQAIMVLLDNATKYSPPGGVVRLHASVDGAWLVVDVTDEGPGIPASALPTIFERFNRGDRTRGEHGTGAGLGLSIAMAIVSAHGGDIAAFSREGAGTRMRLTLPLRGGPAPPPPATAACRPMA